MLSVNSIQSIKALFELQIEGWNSSSEVCATGNLVVFQMSSCLKDQEVFSFHPSICDLKQFPATDFHRFVYGSFTYFIQMFAHWYRLSFTWRIPKICFTCFAKISTSTLPSTEGVHIPHYQDMFADHHFPFFRFRWNMLVLFKDIPCVITFILDLWKLICHFLS